MTGTTGTEPRKSTDHEWARIDTDIAESNSNRRATGTTEYTESGFSARFRALFAWFVWFAVYFSHFSCIS